MSNWLCPLPVLTNQFPFFFSYTCKRFENITRVTFLTWEVSISDHCCQNCKGMVYSVDSVIDIIHHNDECQTLETSVCKRIPGRYREMFLFSSNNEIYLQSMLISLEINNKIF